MSESNNNTTEYQRVVIKGVVSCQSPMHIGSGDEAVRNVTIEGKPSEQTYNDLQLDISGQPYIPGSTLRGYLAQQIREQLDSADTTSSEDKESADKKLDQLQSLLGYTVEKSPDDQDASSQTKRDQGKAGRISVSDARIRIPLTQHQYRTGIAVEHRTRTAKDRYLFSHRLVPVGTEFKVRIEMRQIDSNELDRVINALHSLDGQFGQIGGLQNRGMGVLLWEQQHAHVEVINQKTFVDWLISHDMAPLKIDALTLVDSDTRIDSDRCFTMKIRPLSPLLANDPEQIRKTPDKGKLQCMKREDNKVMVPGSSIKGAFRSQCRRIVLTLLCEQRAYDAEADTRADAITGQLFGDTQFKGLVGFSDAVGDSKDHPQTFIAVDRFTGGVASGALYTVNAADANELSFNIQLRKPWPELEPWQRGMLLLLLRDAMEGDIYLGWGRAKGYGANRMQLQRDDAKDKDIHNIQDISGWRADIDAVQQKVSIPLETIGETK